MVKTRGEGYGAPLANISEAVGNTPLVKISDRICPAGRYVRFDVAYRRIHHVNCVVMLFYMHADT